MKRFIISFVLFFAIGAISAESGTLTVTSVESTPVTGLTVITYDLLTDQIPSKVNEAYNVSVEVSFDGGDTYTAIKPAHLSGDVEEVIPGTGKQIIWNGGIGFPGRYSERTKVRLTATNSFICGISTVTFMYNGSLVTYGTVMVDYGGTIGERCWLDRNLGADPMPFVPATDATGSTDTRLSGDLFQWGRLDDGHQVRDPLSTTTSTLSTTDVPGHGNFILIVEGPYDWRSGQNANLWQGGAEDNNPCPPGWRVPTKDEWDTERASWGSGNNNSAGAIDSPLKLPVAGARIGGNGSVDGVNGFYWSSTVDGIYSRFLGFRSDDAVVHYGSRAFGFSVRCIKD